MVHTMVHTMEQDVHTQTISVIGSVTTSTPLKTVVARRNEQVSLI